MHWKAWTAIDRLLIIWKSDLTIKIERDFFRGRVGTSVLLDHPDPNETLAEKAR